MAEINTKSGSQLDFAVFFLVVSFNFLSSSTLGKQAGL